MIQRFTFGCPLPTESVVLPVEPAAAAVPYLTAEPDGSWSFSLAEDAVVYGLGEMPRGINKRGWHYGNTRLFRRCASWQILSL